MFEKQLAGILFLTFRTTYKLTSNLSENFLLNFWFFQNLSFERNLSRTSRPREGE